MNNSHTLIMDGLTELRDVVMAFAAEAPVVERVGEELLQILLRGGCIFTCGNGGSAADALHMAEELTGKFQHPRPPLAAVCLAADATALTCIANDFGFDHVFERPLRALAKRGDCLVAFSTSGNSPNILEALKAAQQLGVTTVLLTGTSGGKAAPLSTHVIRVPSTTTARIQEIHTFVLHAWLQRIDQKMVPSSPSP